MGRGIPFPIRGESPAENEFGAFYLSQNPSGGRKNNLFIANYSGTNKQINMNQLKSTNQAS